MTKKQANHIHLNELRAILGEKPVDVKWYNRARSWTIEALIKMYEKEVAAL